MESRSNKGCLVIHGLSGTPATVEPVVNALSAAGYNVKAPLLSGHGTNIKELSSTKCEEWWEIIVNSYEDLKREADRISCIGISLGSLLALKLSIEMKEELKAVVAMSTPLVLDPLIEYLAYPLVKYTPIRWFYRYSSKDWEHSVADPVGRKFYMQHSYEKLPTHSVFEIFKLKDCVRSRLNEINIPIFIIHSRLDKVAPFRNFRILNETIDAKLTETMILERSEHVITLDYEKDIVVKAIVDFLDRFS